jgi:sterol desaturase/sphingolipid hydroxylase (fatty acid hydroxylase superfamily)
MNAGNFPIIALVAFGLVVILAPILSFVFLKKERDSIAEFSDRKPLASIFFTEILLWLAAILVAGFLLVMVLGLFVFVNAHVRATGNESVPIAPLTIAFGISIVLSLFGVWLHSYTISKLWHDL